MDLFAPKHLCSLRAVSLLGDFVNNPNEGYRTLVPSKITQNQHPKPKNDRKEILWEKGRRINEKGEASLLFINRARFLPNS